MRAAALAAVRLALLGGPAVLAFDAGGYFEGPRLVAAIVAWALLAALAVLAPAPLLPRSLPARLALGGLAAFTLWVLLARGWAPLAGPAGEDAQRDALYLGALAAGTLAWRRRDWARAVEPLLALGALLVIGYGLAGRLLPGIVELHRSVSANGRLDQPLTYWNATGALAAIGLVLCARLAGDPTRHDGLRAAAAAAAAPLGLGVYLTYSRGALAALGCGLLVLAVLAPTWPQLRAGALAVEAAAVAVAVAAPLDGFASLTGSASARETQGAVMLAVLAVVAVVAFAAQAHGCRAEHDGRLRAGPLPLPRAAHRAIVLSALALAALPYVAAVASERGGAGSANPAFGATSQRLGSVGSHRYAYWRVAVRTFGEHPLAGAGPGSFRVAWLRERPFSETVRDAHSLYLETLAELGLVGLAVLLTFLGGVALAARRTLVRDPALGVGPAAALVVWAVHAGVDWDWELPALTLVGVTLAGMLLARGEAPSAPLPR